MKGKGGTLNAYYLSEISHSGKVTYYIIPTLKQSREAKTMETVRRSAAGKVDEQVEHRGFLGQRNYSMTLSWRIHVIIHLSKSIECTTPRVDSKVNSGLWVISMCQCRFIQQNRCTVPLGDVEKGEETMHEWGQRVPCEISASSSQFCHEPKLL